MQRRHKSKGYPKGHAVSRSGTKTVKACGNYMMSGWGYHPTKGFRRLSMK